MIRIGHSVFLEKSSAVKEKKRIGHSVVLKKELGTILYKSDLIIHNIYY